MMISTTLRQALLRNTSLLALALFSAGTGQAACVTQGTATDCTGTSAGPQTIDGTVVKSLTVANGATVSGGSPAAVSIEIGNPPNQFNPGSLTLTVNGSIAGGSGTGVAIRNDTGQPGSFYLYDTPSIIVAAGGTVTGSTAIDVGFVPGSYSLSNATIDNSGTIMSTSGPAIARLTGTTSAASQIINRASGVIGGISADFGGIQNAGLIDGGSASAVRLLAGGISSTSYVNVSSGGTIRSSGTAATIVADPTGSFPGELVINNSGSIAQTGSGAAVSTTRGLTLNNASGAEISAGGSFAIVAGPSRINNFGVIRGSIDLSGSVTSFSSPSVVDSTQGSILGNLLLGSLNDILYGKLVAGVVQTGISGTIDGGGGTDEFRIRISDDARLTAPLTAPANFEKTILELAVGRTLTLDASYSSTSTLSVTNNGTLVNEASFSVANGPVFDLNNVGLTNRGAIVAPNGTGVVTQGGNFTNEGSITAAGTAANLSSTSFDNSGAISSTGGIGLQYSGCCQSATNSGTISGATAGVVGSFITNGGTITSANIGLIGGGYNKAGALISGGQAGLGSDFGVVFGATFYNAGTVNGGIRYGNQQFSFGSNNYVILLPGGIVNGDIVLGIGGDTLITDFVNTGPGSHAGLTGRVSGGANETIVYRVANDATGTLDPGIFSTVGFAMLNGATLNLTLPSASLSTPLYIDGVGTIDLTGNLTGANRALISSTVPTSYAAMAQGPNTTPIYDKGVSVVSHGNLTSTWSGQSFGSGSAVVLDNADSFTNLGTISVTSTSASTFQASAISGGTVINRGTIATQNAIGINGALRVINSGSVGSIVQRSTSSFTAGGLFVDNQQGGSIGSIQLSAGQSFGGFLDPVNAVTIVNAGTIGGDILFQQANGPLMFVNDGGTVQGSIRNAVSTATDSLIFINRSATMGVTGAVNAGLGQDRYLSSFAQSGSYALGTALPTSFEIGGVEVRGAGTTVTLTGDAANGANGFTVAGDGRVVNQGTINAPSFADTGISSSDQLIYGRTAALLYVGEVGKTSFQATSGNGFGGFERILYGSALDSFVNKGTINGDLLLNARSFANEGSILLRYRDAGTIIRAGADADFHFSNSGDIRLSGELGNPASARASDSLAIHLATAYDLTEAHDFIVDNSGTIDGIAISAFARRFAFTNSGTINGLVNFNIGFGAVAAAPPAAIRAEKIEFTNSGTIEGGVASTAIADVVSFSNSGTINAVGGNGYSSSAISLSAGTRGENDRTSTSMTNSGRIDGGIVLSGFTTTTTVKNSGTIALPASPIYGYAYSPQVLDVTTITLDSNSITLDNSGSMTTALTGWGAIDLRSQSGIGFDGSPAEGSGATSDIRITNSGTIAASGGNLVQTQSEYSSATNNFITTKTLSLATAVLASAQAPGNSSVTIDNALGGTISATGATRIPGPSGLSPTSAYGPATGGLAIVADARTVIVNNNGLIQGAALTRFDTDDFSIAGAVGDFGGIIGGAIDTFGSADTITNGATGVISGGIALRGGNDSLVNRGRIDGDIDFGAGDDLFVQGVRAVFNGTANGGDGFDTALIDITGGGTIDTSFFDRLVNFEKFDITGAGSVTASGALPIETFTLAAADLTIAAGSNFQTQGTTAVTGTAAAESLANAGTIVGDVALGGGGDRFANSGRIVGTVDLGDGDDRVDGLASMAGSVSGGIQGGAGTDIIAFAPTGGSLAAPAVRIGAATLAPYSGFEQVALNGGGVIAVAGALPIDLLTLDATTLLVEANTTLSTTGTTSVRGGTNADQMVVQGQVRGAIDLGGGADVLTLAGTGSVSGPVNLGDGDDRLVLTGAAGFSTINGGTGNDRIEVNVTGTAAAPTEFNLSTVTGFETLVNGSGVTALSGSFALGQIQVTGGRLIGRTGSTISGAVSVASGATFGSAGTVNGSISVAGTLSPGASPGTMTVNGNVALASGSTTLFEMTPTVSDALVINGTLTIASGSTLTLIGNRPLTPGRTYDLITASGGISGNFTTIDKASTVLGFVRQSANAIQLLGTILLPAGSNPQAGRVTDYVNGLLIGGTASQAMIDTIPALLTSAGLGNAETLRRLSPEAFASAGQIGVENGLSLATALRTAPLAGTDEPSLFGFGQSLGSYRRLPGAPATGTVRANVRSGGVVGGVGYGSEAMSAGLFVGYLDGRQQIDGLGASTNSDGIVAGLATRFARGGFEFAGLAAWDGSHAKTRRTILNGTRLDSGYDLHGWTLDGALAYPIALSDDWTLRPEAGLTYVRSKRGSASETGSAFALNVADRTTKASFATGALRIEGRVDRIHPWASIGIRYQMTGERTLALGGFAGNAAGFAVPGVARGQTLGTAAAGFTADLNDRIRLFGNGGADFGADGSGLSGTVGMALRF